MKMVYKDSEMPHLYIHAMNYTGVSLGVIELVNWPCL